MSQTSPAPLNLLVVGDAFVPTEAYLAAATSLDTSPASMLRLRHVELPGTRAEQHLIQQRMEWEGPNSAPSVPVMLTALPGVQILGVHFAPVDDEVIKAGRDLKLIAVARAGLENVDVAAATTRNIAVVPALGRNADAVAELQIGLMLAECRNIARADHSVKAGGWRKDFSGPARELGDATVGMIGFGYVGRAFTRRLLGFGSQLLAYDPYLQPEDFVAHGVDRITDLTTLFSMSDFIIVQARLTADNARFIGQRQFAAMKRTAYFINVARSRLVDYDALYAALAAGRIAGAALDVFDDEPLPAGSPWRHLPNVTLTTHFGGDTTATTVTSARRVITAAHQFATTGRITGAVNARELGWR